MKSSKGRSGRRRWTSEQREGFLADFHQNKMTQRDFSNRRGVGLSTLGKWLRDEGNVTSPPVKFQEVRLPNPSSRWLVEVVSPQGWVVRVQNGSDVKMLPELLQALPC
ncbi:MAG: transposase [Chthoniobacteraceae bacterium]|jgi:transposase-like protein